MPVCTAWSCRRTSAQQLTLAERMRRDELSRLSAVIQQRWGAPDAPARRGAGVVTGAGRQATGAVINFCTYWGVGLALAATLAFRARMGVRGLWVGVLAGSVTQARLARGAARAGPRARQGARGIAGAWRGLLCGGPPRWPRPLLRCSGARGYVRANVRPAFGCYVILSCPERWAAVGVADLSMRISAR